MTDANKKFYFSVVQDDESQSFINKAVSEELVAEIWQKGQDKDQVEEFDILSYDPILKKIKLKLRTGLLGKLTGSRNKDSQVLIKISFGSIYIFTSTTLEYDRDDDTYFVLINQEIYKSQQRSNYRLSANKFIRIQFKIADIVFEALDVSAGGTSFNILPEHEDKFKKGQVYEDCILRLANINYDIPEVKVVGVWENPHKDEQDNLINGKKIGISFVSLPKKTEEALFISINTEARGEELRKQTLERKAKSGT